MSEGLPKADIKRVAGIILLAIERQANIQPQRADGGQVAQAKPRARAHLTQARFGFLADPPGIAREGRREMLDALQALNKFREEAYHDPEIDTRIQQYEMAYKMQTSVPELTDFSRESPATLALYGPDVTKQGSFA